LRLPHVAIPDQPGFPRIVNGEVIYRHPYSAPAFGPDRAAYPLVVKHAFQQRKNRFEFFVGRASRRLGFGDSWVEPLQSRWINVDNLIELTLGNSHSIFMRRHRANIKLKKRVRRPIRIAETAIFQLLEKRYYETNVQVHLGGADHTVD
jgi:hypothetical protein